MESAFWGRSWGAMDAIYREAASADRVGSIANRDLSLYLNALWRQRRYAEGLALMERSRGIFPPSLAPYAGMLEVLGLERAGRKAEALAAGRALWPAPEPIRYHLAYALGRLARDLDAKRDALAWFRRMLAEAGPDRLRRADALREIAALPGATADEGALLLIEQPSNAKALALCSPVARGKSSKVDYALGYRAYLRKNYTPAGERLALAYNDAQFGEAARYYHAYALYREKKYDKALALWSAAALGGTEYPQRSLQRLTALAAAEEEREGEVLALLRKVAAARGDYPDLAADALAALARLESGRASDAALTELQNRYPASAQAASALWERGWGAWKDGESYGAAEAAWSAGAAWAGGSAKPADGASGGLKNGELAARLIYWRARALQKLGRPGAADVGDRLAASCPGEYYTYLLRSDGGVTSADIPAQYVVKSDLEEWGFVTYARIEALSAANAKDPAALFRAARLAHWEGDYPSSVRAFGAFQQLLEPGAVSQAALLRYAYPRPFEAEVSAAAAKTGLDPAIIWGIMRQESLYSPAVTSSAGAYGLMQLMPATAREEERKMKAAAGTYKKPAGNILLGAHHMVGLLARFKDLPRALAAYNAGGTPVTRWSRGGVPDMAAWIEEIPYPETRNYVKAVLRNVETYRTLYGTK